MTTPRDRAMRAMLEGTAELVLLFDGLGTVEYASPSVTLVLGWEPDELVGQNVLSLLHEDDAEAAARVIYGNAAAPAKGLLDQDDIGTAGEYRLRHRDGRWIAIEVLGNNFLDRPDVRGLLAVGRDVSTRHLLDRALTEIATRPVDRADLERLAAILDTVLPGTASALLTDDGWVVPPGSAAPVPADDGDGDGDESPWDRARATGANVVAGLPDGADFRSVWCMPLVEPGTAEPLGCIVVWSRTHDEPLLGWWTTLDRVADLTRLSLLRRRTEAALRHTATHDRLTGLLHRGGFIEAVDAVRAERPGALLLADLDGFKPVNDAHGHAVGDDVLVVAAQRLRSAVRPDDVVGRFGGDEFVVFLPGADVETARTVGERLVLTIAEPVRVGGVEVVIGTSVGIVGSAPQRSLDEQLRRADAALYAAKRAGRGRVIVA